MSSAIQIYKKNPTRGEITSSLTGSTGDGNGLHFDGSAGAINLGSSMPDLGTKYSLEFVVKGDARTGEVYLLDAYNSSSTNRVILAWSGNSNGNIQLHVNGTWSSAFIATPDNGEVVHLLLSVDGTSATLYQNGNSASTQTVVANTLTGATNTHIGASQNGSGNFFNGTIFRTRFWNHALSSSEVQTAFERADVDFADQYGSQTSKILNGTSWTSASGTTPPASWTAGSGQVPNFTIDSSSGSGSEPALKFQRGANNMPYFFQTFTAVIGKKYRVAYRVKNIDAIHVRVGIGSSAVGTQYNVTDYTSTNWADYEDTFTATTTTFSIYVQANTVTGTQGGYIDSVTVEQVGAVVDMDLAFANPTQSLTVQNRSGAADGTCSASGVTQVQPVVQLNSTSARIGTTAATPADGEVVATSVKAETYRSARSDGDVYIQAATASDFVAIGTQVSSTLLKVDGNGKISCVNDITIQKNNGNLILHGTADGSQQAVLFRNDDDEDKGFIKYRDTYSSPGGNTMEVGTDGATRLSIDSSGRVIVGASSMPLKWWNGATYGAKFLVENNGSTAAADYVTSGVVRNTNDGEAPQLGFAKSRGTASGSVNVVQDDDAIGTLTFQAADGTNYVESARIVAKVDGTPGADDMPARLEFMTTADGASSPTKRLTISSTGDITTTLSSANTNTAGVALKLDHTTSGSSAVGFGTLIRFDGERTGSTSDGMGTLGFVADSMSASRIDGAFVVNTGQDGSYTERLRITSTGAVQTPGNIYLQSGGSSYGELGLDSNKPRLRTYGSSGWLNVFTVDNNTGLTTFDQRIHGVGGISFGQTNSSATGAAATSTILDSYEEGTWTPVFQGDSTAGTYTASATGTYTRIGRKVTVYCSLVNVSESAAGSGSIKISGLPFASASGGQGYTSASRVRQYSSAVGPFYALVSPTASYANLMYYVNGSTDAPAPLSGLSSGNSDFTFTLTYFV